MRAREKNEGGRRRGTALFSLFPNTERLEEALKGNDEKYLKYSFAGNQTRILKQVKPGCQGSFSSKFMAVSPSVNSMGFVMGRDKRYI